MRVHALLLVFLVACIDTPQEPIDEPVEKTPATERADRRAYDGAPPVMPHDNLGASCTNCHAGQAMQVDGLGVAPAMPHDATPGLSDDARCRQCHVPVTTDHIFKPNEFEGQAQDMREGDRLYAGAPPVMPHRTFMRENCVACHDGLDAREEIKTPHADRTRCQQCHVEAVTDTSFPH